MRKIPAQSEINQEKFTEGGESPTTHIHTQNIWIASSRTCAVIWIWGYRGWRLAILLLNALQRKTRKMLHFPSGHLAGLFTTPLTQVASGTPCVISSLSYLDYELRSQLTWGNACLSSGSCIFQLDAVED